jgi:hypothetical protein
MVHMNIQELEGLRLFSPKGALLSAAIFVIPVSLASQQVFLILLTENRLQRIYCVPSSTMPSSIPSNTFLARYLPAVVVSHMHFTCEMGLW